MNLFGKKKEEEIEEELLSEKEKLADRRLTRKFKDLNPENKRKRKEPPKPWGKFERIIVAVFLIVTTLIASALFLISHEYKFPGLPKITFSGINFVSPDGGNVIEIGQKKSVPEGDTVGQKAIQMFNEETNPLSGVYGFYVIRLGSGSSYGVSTNSVFQGASLIKLPLIILMYRMSEQGSLNLETLYTLKDSDKVKGSGYLSTKNAGSIYTYRELAKFMGKNSDRTAYNIMKNIIGESVLNDFVMSAGMMRTNIVTGDTTPSDIGILFRKLWQGEFVSTEDRDEILNYLTDTDYENWITKGVPDGINVAHKFGRDMKVMADGGIVLSANPYVLVIMGNGITERDADLLFPKVSQGIYNLENNSTEN